MKKLISFLLVVTLFTCGIFICPNETIKAVYASDDYYTIEYDDSLAYTPLEYDPDREYTAEELSYDCLRYYGAESIVYTHVDENEYIYTCKKLFSAYDIDPSLDGEEDAYVNISIHYNADGDEKTRLDLSCEDYGLEDSMLVSPVFYDEYFDGTVELEFDDHSTTVINVFDDGGEDFDDDDDDDDDEDIEIEAVIGFPNATMSVDSKATPRVAITISTGAVYLLGALLVCMVGFFQKNKTFPTYTDSEFGYTIPSSSGITELINRVKYKFEKLTETAIDSIRNNPETKKIYYVAIPITSKNAHKFSDCSDGDMLICPNAISYENAKKVLKAGYSLYTFLPKKARHILTLAYPYDSYIRHNAHKPRYYDHYHPCDIGSHERVGYIRGVEISIHSFYGFPKA